MDAISLVGKGLYQWDRDRKIKVTPKDGCTVAAIEYSRCGDVDAIRTEHIEKDGFVLSPIPNDLLQKAINLTVYVMYRTEDGYYTDESATFIVEERSKPADYIYKDTETYSIKAEVEKALREAQESGEFGAVSSRVAYIDLLSANWHGSDNLYSQVVDIDGVTEYSKVDINPSVEQLAVFYQKDIAFVTENEDGVVTVYCIGQKPLDDYTMQVTITEVIANG